MKSIFSRYGVGFLCFSCVALAWNVAPARAGVDACSNQEQVDACKVDCESDDGPCASVCGSVESACLDECDTDCVAECIGPCLIGPVECVACEAACIADRTACNNDCFTACNECSGPCMETCALLCVNCDAGGPYLSECEGTTTTIDLDASGSSDPQNTTLDFQWTTDCPGGSFNDSTIALPVLTVDTNPGCEINCNVTVTVTDQDGGTASCESTVGIVDELDPEVGTPAALEPCYPTLLDARNAACAATLAVSSDQCDVDLTCDTIYDPPAGTCAITITATIEDDCDNSTDGPPLETIVDNELPTIDCPDDITVVRGDKICGPEVQDWLDSVQFDDNCPGATVTNDSTANGFECGFPPGTTTTVTFTVTDACGLTASCTADITVDPLHRIDTTQKGSLLVFSKVEIKWDAAGNLTQDTFLDFSNDFDGGPVDVQAFLINGDRTLEEITTDDGTVIQDAEPGWNRIDCRFELTKNQPHYWSAANGSSMCGPFTSLDGDGPGRPDPEVAGGRVLRGYVVMWAVKFNGEYYDEIRWNHLKGDALIINYSEGSAWEYNAWAAQARCGANGAPVQDCLITDANGTCCLAEPIPGNIGLDGFAYDVTYDRLLLDFYATGTTALSAIRADGSAGVGISLDTDLTLHSMDIDLRQDGDGPPLTKAEFEVFNQNEVKLSGLRRCICCWDQTMFSDYVQHAGIPNYFLRQRLGTDKGQARIDAVRSVVEECNYCETCGVEPRIRRTPITASTGGTAGIGEIIDVCQLNFSQDTALLGLSTKFVNFENGSLKIDRAGMNLVGTGEQTRVFQLELNGDNENGSGGVATHQTTILQYGSRIQYDVPRGTDEARTPVSISQPRETRSGKQSNPVETLRGDRTKE